MTRDWLQTIVVLVTVALATAGMTLWFSNNLHSLDTQLIGVESQLEELRKRMEEGGWSLRQQMMWVEVLREAADHKVPSPAQFPPKGVPGASN